MGHYDDLDVARMDYDGGDPDDSAYFFDRAERLQGEKATLEADLAAAKREVARLASILREVRMHCTFDGDDAAVFAKVWPLVLAFDDVA